MQHTLAKAIEIKGIGLHSGRDVRLVLRPAAADRGITFIRTDIRGKNNGIPALWNYVVDTQLCTVIGNADDVRVATIEHLMAALRGCGVDNVTAEIDGPEIPVMDGSAMPFVELIDAAGLAAQAAPRRVVKVLKEVVVEQDGKRVTLSPSDDSRFSGDIEFDHAGIGSQRYETKLLNGNFRHDIADARTFGFLREVEWMRQNGLGLGGSLDNAIVLNDQGVMNPGGLRHDDEFIRHKILDAIGDLYLAGGRIQGAYDGSKAGHAMNNAVLRKLFSMPDAWVMVDVHGDDAGTPPSAQKTSESSVYA